MSFSGTARFKKNVSNLGGLMKDVRLNIKALEERGDDVVQSEWSFSCVLDLPWKPRLAAAGGTTHVFSLETGRVVKHIERWDIEVRAGAGLVWLPPPLPPPRRSHRCRLSADSSLCKPAVVVKQLFTPGKV